jgi:Inosine-uridine nucleoside N-ribohydrolase
MREKFYEMLPEKQVRLIVDADAACECDDQYAIAHALMSQKVEVRALTAEHFGKAEPGSMEKSYQEMIKIVSLMELNDVKVLHGCEHPMLSEMEAMPSEATDFIIEETLREDTRPLFIICQGAVTNVASALVKKPEIGKKLTVIWVGGSNYPVGGYEFNSLNDVHAANALLASEADVWMLPAEVYSTLQVGFEELYLKVAPFGEIGKYLYENMIHENNRITEMLMKKTPLKTPASYLEFPNGGSWAFGDSCAIGLLLSTNSGDFELVAAPRMRVDGTYEIQQENKMIRYYKNVNTRFILEDFFCKLAYYYGREL